MQNHTENVIALKSRGTLEKSNFDYYQCCCDCFAISFVWFYMLFVFTVLAKATSSINAPGT